MQVLLSTKLVHYSLFTPVIHRISLYFVLLRSFSQYNRLLSCGLWRLRLRKVFCAKDNVVEFIVYAWLQCVAADNIKASSGFEYVDF